MAVLKKKNCDKKRRGKNDIHGVGDLGFFISIHKERGKATHFFFLFKAFAQAKWFIGIQRENRKREREGGEGGGGNEETEG